MFVKRRGAIFSPSNTPGVLDDPIPLSCKNANVDEEKVESLDHFEDFDTAKNCPQVWKDWTKTWSYIQLQMPICLATEYLFPKSRQLPWAKHKTTLLSLGLMMDDSV